MGWSSFLHHVDHDWLDLLFVQFLLLGAKKVFVRLSTVYVQTAVRTTNTYQAHQICSTAAARTYCDTPKVLQYRQPVAHPIVCYRDARTIDNNSRSRDTQRGKESTYY